MTKRLIKEGVEIPEEIDEKRKDFLIKARKMKQGSITQSKFMKEDSPPPLFTNFLKREKPLG
jgi:hypothetical protein